MEASRPTTAPAFSVDQTDELQDYHSLCGQAIVGLVLGIASPCALVRPLLVVIPLAAVLVCGIALAHIRSSQGRLVGGRIAVAGLCLGVMFVAAVPALQVTRARLLQRRAQPIAQQWFQFLAQDEPHKALQLTRPYQERLPLDDNLWNLYRRSQAARDQLEEFVETPLIRALLALGKRAQVRYYQAGAIQVEPARMHVERVYAVTYEDASGRRKSFFARLLLLRQPRRDGSITWRVMDFSGGMLPPD